MFTQAEEISRLRAEVEERSRQLQQIINGLVAENMKLKAEIEGLRKEFWERFDEAQKRFSKVEEVEKAVKRLQEEIERLK